MARKTKAQLAAEAEATEEQTEEELNALLEQGYEAGEDEDNWVLTEDDLAELRDAEEAGDYEAFKAKVTILCTEVKLDKGKDSGDRYLKLTWVVQDGPYERSNIWDIIMLQGKGVGFGKKKLNQLGLTTDGLSKDKLEGLLVSAQTKVQKAKAGTDYDDKTVIQKYLGAVGVTTSEDLPG